MPCGQPSSAASIWPVWLQSSSIACLPRMTRPGLLRLDHALEDLGHGERLDDCRRSSPGCRGRRPWRAPVRIVSAACAGPIDTTTTSVALPASFRRIASSTAISSKGFIDILTLASSTPEPSGLDPDLDVVVDHPLDGDENLHRSAPLIPAGRPHALPDTPAFGAAGP